MGPKLLHMSVMSFTGTIIFQQHLNKQELNQDLITQICTVAMGFRNTADISISSLQYDGFTIYFRRGANFLAILVSSGEPEAEEMINSLFDQLLKEKVLGKFVEYAHNDIFCNDIDIISRIRRIMYNLDFADSLSSFKQELSKNKRVF